MGLSHNAYAAATVCLKSSIAFRKMQARALDVNQQASENHDINYAYFKTYIRHEITTHAFSLQCTKANAVHVESRNGSFSHGKEP